jgi:oligopeptidase B
MTLLADNPDGEFKVFQKRKRGLEYSISHFEDHIILPIRIKQLISN